jgi:hypothetical protein
MYEVHTNEEIEWFINMCIFYHVSLLPNPLQNTQQHQHKCTCKKKKCCFRYHHPLPPMHETKILVTFQIDGNHSFSQHSLLEILSFATSHYAIDMQLTCN